MRETKKDNPNSNNQTQVMAPTMRTNHINLSKYPNQNLNEYESKNPNVVNHYAKMEKSPVYAKKQPNMVRLDPINATSLPTNLNKPNDFSTNLLESGSLPKLGRRNFQIFF